MEIPAVAFPRDSCSQGPAEDIDLSQPQSPPYPGLYPTHPGLQLLDLLLASLQGQLLCLIQAVLQVLHRLVQVLLHPLQVGTGVSLHLLLQPQSFISAPDLRIQGALHGIYNSEMVSLQLVNFLIFLCYFPVNVRLDLVEFQLDTKDLPLFMF
uniref:Uncharacterized protein n=1 Tax=Gallus gallus TaxID=9031 RepID=A0A8V1AP28_CHICK